MSRIAAVIAGLYLISAISIIVWDSQQSHGGNWITLKHMGEFLVTFPVSAPLAMMGWEPDLGNKFTLSVMLLATTGLIYGVVAQIVKLLTFK